jgi:hypothetical protein
MKKHFIFLLISLFISENFFSQTNSIPDTLVIFGADFSLSKIVTKHNYNPDEVLQVDFPRVNYELIKISQSFITNFQAHHVIFDSADVKRINGGIKKENLFTDKRFIFSGGDSIVRTVLKNYNTTGHTNGAGLVFVMEKIDEIDDRESFYLLMFDLNTKKIIHCDKIETGLSRVKNEFPSGWFSWKTGINKTLEEMDDVYDFWNNYPEKEPINISAKAPNKSTTEWEEIKQKKKDSIPGVKNWKIISVNVALNMLSTNLDTKYRKSFASRGLDNSFGITDFYALPKFNLGFQYGIKQKLLLGAGIGYDKSTIEWGDTLNNTFRNNDTWQRYQIFATVNYSIVKSPKFIFYIGPQLGYNIIKFSYTGPGTPINNVELSPLTGQVNIGISYFIKGIVGINHEMALGFGSCDFFKIGITAKF